MIRNFLKDARELLFNKRISNMNSNTVQGAIDELKGTIGYIKKNHFESITSGFTYKGITALKNEDGSFTVTGTATANVDYQLSVDIYPDNEQYILSGYTEGADADCNIYAAYWEDSSTWLSAEPVLDDKGVLITKEKGNLCKVCLYVASGKTVNMTFYPMVRYASITDDTYEPYDGVDSVDSRLDTLENALEWKLAGSANNQGVITLPSNYNELIIECNNTTDSMGVTPALSTIYVSKAQLTSDYKYFEFGPSSRIYSSKGYNNTVFKVAVKTTSVYCHSTLSEQSNAFLVDNNDETTTTVYYR